MKKAKLLTLLAVLTLTTIPAHAAGSCPAVRDNVQWKVFCSAPTQWSRCVPFACPDFLCPGADSGTTRPDVSAPDTACPNGATCAPDTVFIIPDWMRPESGAPAVPAAPNTDAPARPNDAAPNRPGDTEAAAPDAPTVPATPAAPETPESTAPSNAGMSAYETEVVRLVNVERAKYGLAALSADAELSRGARAKSQDMRDKGYFSHESPTYGSPFQMMKSFGISYRTAGENIAYGYSTPAKVVEAWMNSEGHRANILNASYTRLGVGYVADGHYWTQWFVG